MISTALYTAIAACLTFGFKLPLYEFVLCYFMTSSLLSVFTCVFSECLGLDFKRKDGEARAISLLKVVIWKGPAIIYMALYSVWAISVSEFWTKDALRGLAILALLNGIFFYGVVS